MLTNKDAAPVTSSTLTPQRKCALISELAEAFPAAFKPYGPSRRPLKVGIRHDLKARFGDRMSWRLRLAALHYYTRNADYLAACLVEGAERIDLDGNPAGTVTAHEADHAAALLRERRERTRLYYREKRKKAALAAAAQPAPSPTPPTPPPKKLGLADLKAAATQRKQLAMAQ